MGTVRIEKAAAVAGEKMVSCFNTERYRTEPQGIKSCKCFLEEAGIPHC